MSGAVKCFVVENPDRQKNAAMLYLKETMQVIWILGSELFIALLLCIKLVRLAR